MLLGNKARFAIECVHEPLKNESRRVFGRMAVWVDGACLGDFEEPACMLNETGGHLEDLIKRLPTLRDEKLNGLSDFEVFAYLDRVLYLDDDRTNDQVIADSRRFFKFDFLTNGGESFDHTKSFIVGSDGYVRVMFRDEKNTFSSGCVAESEFKAVVQEFLAWIAAEGERAS